ncbi:MAG: GHMP kinase [Acidobacteriota bacterium]
MQIIEKLAHARAGLLGNPSDGYFGKTVSVTFRDFRARIVLYEWPELEIILSRQDRCEFSSLDELVDDVRLNGLYGGLRLIKATIKVFTEFCRRESIELPQRNFALRYETDIPRQVGMAGSSAIVTAAFRALMEFYGVDVPNPVLANLVLSVETEEIGIAAGLQDRVCQVYGGLVYMDFAREHFERQGFGEYEVLNPGLLPPLYIAYRRNLSQISGIYHSNLRERWIQGDAEVVHAMQEFARLAEAGRQALLAGDYAAVGRLMDRNFDIRSHLVRLDPVNVEMVKAARRIGVSAKYAGSGGSIVGICEDPERFERLRSELAGLDCEVLRPRTD